MSEQVRKHYKLSDLTDEQLLHLFDSVQLDEEMLSISSDDEGNEFDVVEALNTALEDVSAVSFIDNTVENVENMVQESEPTRKPVKRPRSPLPSIEHSACMSSPSSGGFNGLGKRTKLRNGSKMTYNFFCIGIDSIAKEPSKIIWRQQSMKLHVNEVSFQGDSSLSAEIMEFETPLQMFCYFFNSDIMNMIVEETMRAALTDNITNQFKMNIDDIHHYVGILMYMSIYRYPNLKSYWGRNAFGPIKNCMTRGKFEAIKQYFSLRDEIYW